MPDDPTDANKARGRLSVEQGEWGEAQAAQFLIAHGWKVIGRNLRPCPHDLRCEIDLIVGNAKGDQIVFVEVKTHKKCSPYATRLASVNARKKKNLLRAYSNWIVRQHWHGNFRFDVVEVYGSKDSGLPPVIDHIENVPLFPPKWRFW